MILLHAFTKVQRFSVQRSGLKNANPSFVTEASRYLSLNFSQILTSLLPMGDGVLP
jgi:hypothetical protein